MQVALADRERQSMLFIGPIAFTYDNPGPVEVDLNKLNTDQKNQLLYNYRQGVITVDPEQELLDSCQGFPAARDNFATPKEQPIVNTKPPTDAMEQLAEERKKLKEILNAHHATIKKTTAKLKMAHVKELLKLEKEGKKRKSLINFFSDLLKKHEKLVAEQVGGVDLDDVPGVYAKDEMVRRSQFVSDIVESEEKEVTLIPSDEELEAANG